jgi:hypothetical protein
LYEAFCVRNGDATYRKKLTIKLVKALLEAGANPSLANRDGQSPRTICPRN